MASRPSRPPGWPIVVSGGGAAGLAFAAAVAQAAGPAVAITVADPALAAPRRTGRAYALSPASVQLLRGLGAWAAIAGSACPITDMIITDGRVDGAPHPDYLAFADEGRPLAVMVEEDRLSAALRSVAEAAGVALRSDAAAGLGEAVPTGRDLALADGAAIRAALVVAADGARSRLREAAGIGWTGRDYPQSGIVGTVRHARPHRGRAIQHFLPAGPFAILPLPDGDGGPRSSIVWTERSDRVAALLALDPAAREAEMRRRFGPDLGEATLEGGLSAHPLAVGLARRFVADRLALVGDAAHRVHPLAGYGLNLGLADAAALAERVVDALRLGLDPGGPDVLAAYERDRRFDAVRIAAVTDGLNRLFSNDLLPLRALRDIGLGLVDRVAGAKGGLLAAAAGTGERAPRMLRGEPL